MKKRLLAIFLVCALIFSFAGCANDAPSATGSSSQSAAPSNSKGNTADKPMEVTWVYTKPGFDAPPENNIILQEIEKKTGVKLNLISPPFATYNEKVSIIMASNDLPDVIKLPTLSSMYDYAEQGALLPLDDMVKIMPNVQKTVPQEAMDICKVDGVQYAIPIWTSQHRYNVSVRQDWLDKLNLKTPETLDDYYNVLKAFHENDPDGNSKKDSYGIGGIGLEAVEPIFGAFGVMGVHRGYWYDENGVLKPQATNPKAKEALAVLAKWYKEGLLDPEFIITKNSTEYQQKAYKNQVGMTHAWWTTEPKIELEMRKIDANVTWTRVAPPVGPEGISGARGTGWVDYPVVVLKTAKDPEAVAKLIDFSNSDEGMMIEYAGVEGTHWEKKSDGLFYTLPQANTDAKWIQWYALFQSEPPLFSLETNLVQSRRDSLKWNVIPNAADGLITQAEVKYVTDLNTLVQDAYGKIITGKEGIDYFDKFAEEYNKNGGSEWAKEVNEIYKSK